MTHWLVAAAVSWPVLLGAATWQEAHGHGSVWTAGVYLAASRVCHQQPARSFRSRGTPWPVCGRCSGLYVGGAVGALLAAGLGRRLGQQAVGVGLIAAAVPTVLSLGLEWSGLGDVDNLGRAAVGVPLGAAVAAAIVWAARPAAIK